MSNNGKVLALICARGGSKGVPGKNVKHLCGKPLIQWSIECAKNCTEIDDIVVSTDCSRIAEASKNAGAEVPFMRPDFLASDQSKQIDAIAHALEFLKEQEREYKAIALLQPTCPLRKSEDISGALQLLEEQNADTVITVTEGNSVVFSTFYDRSDDGRLEQKFEASKEGTIRQDFPAIYKRCGVIYILRPDYILKNRVLYGEKVYGYVIPEERSFDIDTQFDWELTEVLMNKRLRDENR